MFQRTKLVLILAICGLALYFPSLHYAPFFDDNNFFERGQLHLIFLNGFEPHPRWLPYFTMAWLDLLFDDNVFVQRCTSLSLHVLTSYALYALVKQVADHAVPHRNNQRGAAVAALLFLLHPLAVYATGYLVQRTIVMATLFGLLCLSAYFNGLISRRSGYFLFSALFYLLSVFSKEHAVLIPLVALALTPLAVRANRQLWRELLLPYALYVPIAVFVLIKSISVIGQVYEPFAARHLEQTRTITDALDTNMVWYLSVVTQTALFFKYLALMFVPYPGWMSIDMRVPVAVLPLESKYILSVFALVLYGVTALILLLKGGRRGLVGFALLSPLLLFIVELSAVRVQEPFVLYRTYLWVWPLCFLLPALTNHYSNKLFWSASLGLMLVFSVASSERLRTFSGGYALWDDAVEKLPDEPVSGKARVYANRASWNVKRGDFEAAVADYTSALGGDPKFKKALTGRAYAYAKLGKYNAALRDVNAFLMLYPEDAYGYTLRGLIYRDKGDMRLAISDLEYACSMKAMGGCVSLSVTRLRYSQSKTSGIGR